MSKVIRVGVMPGRIQEVVVEGEATFKDVLALAELNASGYDVKADSVKVNDLDQKVGDTNLLLLAKQVKGNADKTVRVGVMPGRIQEFIVETGASISEVLTLAELDPKGYDVKVDSVKVEDLNTTKVTEATNLVLLAKQVKGNK